MSLGRVDRYDLLALIGEGSFGGVYRARHIHTGHVHALKLAREAVDPEGAARVLAEARAAASLRHPHVVGVIDGGVAATGESFIVMELLEGMTLAQLIKKEGPLPLVRAIRIARQMLDGLAAAHANGIVHRDVKPSNVFITTASDVTGGDMVKVIDFGISKMRMTAGAAGNLTLPGVAMGTPGYMAPEQLGDARSVDPRADIYAVGATLFEMLAMRTPIEADSFETWMRRLRTEPAPLLGSVAPHVPSTLCAVVDRALARDPDARWPSASAMRGALDVAFTSPQDAFSPTATETPRIVLPATFPQAAGGSGFGGPAFASTPPPVLPTLPMHAPQQAYSQPPLQYSAAPQYPPARSSGSMVPWIVAAVAIVLVLVVMVGAGAAFYVMRPRASTATATATPAEPATVATTAAVNPAAPGAAAPAARPVAGGPSPAATSAKPGAAPAPGPTTAPTAPGAPVAPAPAAPAAKVTGSVRISPPRIVGELRQDAFMALAGRARPAIEQCNPERRALTVKVDVMIGDKKITIAQPSVNTNPGDPLIARCVAQSLKDAQFAAFAPGSSGIYQEAQFSW